MDKLKPAKKKRSASAVEGVSVFIPSKTSFSIKGKWVSSSIGEPQHARSTDQRLSVTRVVWLLQTRQLPHLPLLRRGGQAQAESQPTSSACLPGCPTEQSEPKDVAAGPDAEGTQTAAHMLDPA